MKVLQANVRLTEGGAARVAKTLHDGLNSAASHSSIFAYGYGPGGGPSPGATPGDTLRITGKAEAATNFVAHQLAGREQGAFKKWSLNRFMTAALQVDVVHLHVMHSYWLSPGRVMNALADARVPVVWTLHDQWLLTGRCAQPGSCSGWTVGCASCPDKSAYPPALIDFASGNYKRRRADLQRLNDATKLAIVPCATWLGDLAIEAGLPSVRPAIHNSVDHEFADAARAVQGERDIEFLILHRDLSDRAKLDWSMVKTLKTQLGERLMVVGDNPPEPISRQTPALTSRTEIARLFARTQRLIFLSSNDYFPLTVVEALAAGAEVIAIKSPASRELAERPGVTLIDDVSELASTARRPLSARATDDEYFNPVRMTEDYLKIYEELAR